MTAAAAAVVRFWDERSCEDDLDEDEDEDEKPSVQPSASGIPTRVSASASIPSRSRKMLRIEACVIVGRSPILCAIVFGLCAWITGRGWALKSWSWDGMVWNGTEEVGVDIKTSVGCVKDAEPLVEWRCCLLRFVLSVKERDLERGKVFA
jgi:hypothetical protein